MERSESERHPGASTGGASPAFRCGRGRDASYPAPAAQIRTCGFPAYGSHLGYDGVPLAVCAPALVTRLPGTESGPCFAGSHSPQPSPFAPPTPQRCTTALFVGFTATMTKPDVPRPCII